MEETDTTSIPLKIATRDKLAKAKKHIPELHRYETYTEQVERLLNKKS